MPQQARIFRNPRVLDSIALDDGRSGFTKVTRPAALVVRAPDWNRQVPWGLTALPVLPSRPQGTVARSLFVRFRSRLLPGCPGGNHSFR